MSEEVPKSVTMPVGVVMRRTPGVTRWAKWAWKGVAVLPGAGPADFRVIRQEGDVTDYHIATMPMELHRTEVESYRTSLMMTPPSVFAVLKKDGDAGNAFGIDLHLVTASADLAQEYQDSAEMIVEPIAMPDGMIGWIASFCEAHFKDVPFRKRRRDRVRVDLKEDGKGDARIRQVADVYRSPGALKPGAQDE